MAIVLQKTLQLNDAIKQMTKVVEQKPDDKVFLLERGILYQ